MRSKLILFFSFLLGTGCWSSAFAQKNWLVKAELGGGATTYQLGAALEIDRWQMGVGVGHVLLLEEGTEKQLGITTVPVQMLYSVPFGSGLHAMELGLGVSNLVLSGDLLESGGSMQWHLNPHALLQYRYAPANKSWQFRAGIQPVLGTRSILSPTREAFRPFGLPVLPLPMLGLAYRL